MDESNKIEKDFRKTDYEGKVDRVQFWDFLLEMLTYQVPLQGGSSLLLTCNVYQPNCLLQILLKMYAGNYLKFNLRCDPDVLGQ